jgi:hypothetical protein
MVVTGEGSDMAPLDVSILLSTRNRVHVPARTLEAFRALDTRDLT